MPHRTDLRGGKNVTDARGRPCSNLRVTGISLLIVAIAACVGGHLWAEAAGRRALRALLKLSASAGFLGIALLARTPGAWSSLILVGLALSAVGDLCLLARGRGPFLAGISSFLLAHVAYVAAFLPASTISSFVAALFAVVAVLVLGWLWPHLGPLRGPVIVYAAAISAMAFFGLGAPGLAVPLGAALFYLSDVTVARDRFVAAGLANRLVGIPLYYAAQLLFAFTVGAP